MAYCLNQVTHKILLHLSLEKFWKFTLQFVVECKVPNCLRLCYLMTSQLVLSLHNHFIGQTGDVLNQFMTKLCFLDTMQFQLMG